MMPLHTGSSEFIHQKSGIYFTHRYLVILCGFTDFHSILVQTDSKTLLCRFLKCCVAYISSISVTLQENPNFTCLPARLPNTHTSFPLRSLPKYTFCLELYPLKVGLNAGLGYFVTLLLVIKIPAYIFMNA